MGTCCSRTSKEDGGAPRPAPHDDDDPVLISEREAGVFKQELSLKRVSSQPRAATGSQGVGGTSSQVKLSGSRLSHEFTASNRLKVSHELTANSQANFAQPDQTIIIFDWDDTLCPSTWMRKHVARTNDPKGKAKPFESDTRNELKMLTEQIIRLLLYARELGQIVMVTNARRPWVDYSCKNFLPAVRPYLRDVRVIYALELVDDDVAADYSGNAGGFLTETKARAMHAAVTQFYSRYENQSWKNVVSIGDALFEHNAIRQVVADRLSAEPGSAGAPKVPKKCRTKTIKLLEGPTIAGLVVQLSIVESWLPKIVGADTDVNIDLSSDEAKINQWVDEYGQE